MLHAVVSDLTTVPEAYHPAYTEKDGKFFLQVTGAEGYTLENTTGLKNALAAERTLRERSDAGLAAFKDIDAATARAAIASVSQYGDITPEKAQQLAADVARLSAIDPSKEAGKLVEAQVEQARGVLTQEFTTKENQYKGQIDALAASNDGLKGQLRTLLVGNQIKAELGKLGPVEDAQDAIELLAERHIKTIEKDGKFEVQVLDAAGNARVKLDGSNLVPFTVADLMAEIKEQKPGLFKADQKGGVGITPGNGQPRGGVSNPWLKDNFNRTEQAKLTNSNPTLAAQLKAAAGFK